MNGDFGANYITIKDEDGTEFELEILDTIELDGETYTVFVPAEIDEMDVNDPDYGLIFLRHAEQDGEEVFESIDSDEELDRVYEYYQQLLDEEDDSDSEAEEKEKE